MIYFLIFFGVAHVITSITVLQIIIKIYYIYDFKQITIPEAVVLGMCIGTPILNMYILYQGVLVLIDFLDDQ